MEVQEIGVAVAVVVVVVVAVAGGVVVLGWSA